MKAHNTLLATLLISAICALVSPSAMGQCAQPSFNAALMVDAGPLPSDIAAGDFNADGRTDFVVPNLSIDEVFVFLGQSIGAPTALKLTSVQKPAAAGVADFNRDGKMDLIISSDTFGARSVSILLGDGTGGFGPPAKFPTLNVKPLIVGDFNNDGNADVFLGNTSGGLSQLLLGNGVGGLSGGSSFNSPGNGGALAADFNSDGNLDVVQLNNVNFFSSFFSIIFGDGTGNFVVTRSFPVTRPTFITAGDFNNDSKTDLVISGEFDRISLFTGDGDGNFALANTFNLGFSVDTLAAGDFNADGKSDIALTADNRAAIFVGDGNGGFGAPNLYRTANNSTGIDIVVGDFDGDGKADFAIAYQPGHTGRASIFFGDGSGKLRFPSILPVGLSPFAITNSDLNNDGHSDLAYTNISHNSVSILISDGSGGFGPPTNFPVGAQPRSLALGDLNDDHKLDLVTANFGAGSVSILLGDGQGGFGPASHVNVPGSDPQSVAIGDINNDERLDLVVAYLSTPSVSLLLGDGDGTFGPPTNHSIPAGGHDIAINDLNLDGLPDVVIATDVGLAFLLAIRSGVFFGGGTLLASSVAAMVVDDFNSDGKADIAALVPITRSVNVYLGGSLNAVPVQIPFVPTFLRAADFNGDGNTDLATSNEQGTVSIALGNGSGTFAAPVTYYTGAARVPHTLTTGDFNSDGHPDIALTDEAANVALIFNSCSATPVTVPTLSISDVTVTEPDTGTVNMTFNVSLSAASSKPVVVDFYVPARAAAGVLTFAPGVTVQTITLPVPGDVLDEFDEPFHVLLAFPLNAVIGNGQALGTILDNDPTPAISVTDVTVGVGMTSAVFTVSLSAPSGKPISVNVATSDGTAQAGLDYEAKTQTLDFAVGETSRTFTVAVLADNINEPDENFFVNLSNPVNVTIADAQGAGTIVNDNPLFLILDESGPAPDQAAALESLLLVRDPFHVQSIATWWPNLGPDRRTRVTLFAANLHLNQGDSASSVVVSLVGSNNQNFEMTAEDVRALSNTDFTQVVFALPSNLSAGVCIVAIKAQGKISNTGTIRIAP